MPPPDAEPRSLASLVASVPWYHTIDLGGGVVTPGEYDHRSSVSRVPLPQSLAGQRCLDVGTHDGFWAFEMERRGASDVVAIDLDDWTRLDWPAPRPEVGTEMVDFLDRRRRAFSIAHQALASLVDRRDLSVYDLTVDEVGRFDLAFIGTLLHHLRDPVGALMAIRRVVSGPLIVCGVISVSETIHHPWRPAAAMSHLDVPFWEVPNIAGLRRQITAGGWTIEQMTRPFFQRFGAGATTESLRTAVRSPAGLPHRLLYRFGAPHVAVLARPTHR